MKLTTPAKPTTDREKAKWAIDRREKSLHCSHPTVPHDGERTA